MCHFLQHPYVGVTRHEPGLVPFKKNVIQKSPSISCFAGMNFYDTLSFNDEDCFRRCLSESGHLTFTVCEK